MKKRVHSHKVILMRERNFTPVSPVFCGREVCNPGHSNEQFLDLYLIHYVESGKGKYYVDGQIFEITQGHCFIIYPYQHHHYVADLDDPWTYSWFSFRGELGKKLDDFGEYVFKSDGKFFPEMLRCSDYGDMQEEYLAGKIIDFMCHEFNENKKISYPDTAKSIIDSSYSSHLSVDRIAESIGVDRRYLSKIFKEKYNITMKNYIIQKRMAEARRFLKDGFSVSEVSQLVGYEDPFAFSRAFKKECGYAPSSVKGAVK